ncbi:FadR/GntR family transcriptional regulator [Aureimonas sp. AU22]|uniref:FadR/GntR family transcriptional regulator n=1 Tax=Aureimonas sp. AU22 TaxID=1638162 RepID=UPI00078255E8|nr:FadR/GntR family transcriptional regulator [Aureimonas sp. AU22]
MPASETNTSDRGVRRGRSQRLHGSIAQEIGTAILTGVYAPGDLLANEVDFSERLSVSRTAYREAVRILAAKGLVSSRPKAGTRVNARSTWNFLDPDILRWIFENGPPPPAFVRELFELRRIVEPAAAGLAALRHTKGDLAELRAALDLMGRHGLGVEEGRNADRVFHETILRATQNEALGTLASGIAAAVRWTTLFKSRDGRMPRDPVPEHAKVLNAIATGDAEGARSAMENLVGLAFQDIRSVDPRLIDESA